jgi:hypothetical protein
VSAPNRIDLLKRSDSLVGIDFIRVSPDQRQLSLYLHHKSPLAAGLLNSLNSLHAEQISIKSMDGGQPELVRVLSPLPALGLDHGRRVMRLQVAEPGGFGRYRLFVDHPAFDPYFNDIPFSFKAACDSDLDCASGNQTGDVGEQVDFPVDYRARDFWSFRQALLDFASQRYPDWQDRLEADLGMVMVELLSALGDEFAYAQDRISREVQFDSASQRRSLRHLARLVDYCIDNGSGARAWLNVSVVEGNGEEWPLPGGTAVGDADGRLLFEIGHGLRDRGREFSVSSRRNQFHPHIWDEDDTCLPAGSNSLTLKGHHAACFDADGAIDPEGKWVLLTTHPRTPDQPDRRLMVRIPFGGARDCLDPLDGPTAITQISWEQATPWPLDLTTLVVYGNLLPATSGETRISSFRIGSPVDPDGADAAIPPAIERVGPNSCLGYEVADSDSQRVRFLHTLSGSESLPLVWLPDPDNARLSRPELLVRRRGDGPWEWLPQLVGETTASGRAKVFTLEDGSYRPVFDMQRSGRQFQFHDYAANGGTTIRFGDGEFGMEPSDGSVFTVEYRLGNGRLMNVAADTLTRFPENPPLFVAAVSNPLPAEGGRDPETEESIRINAPQAFRNVLHSAVRPEDFDLIARRELSWLQRSGSVMRWTGSWPTLFVTPDPRGGVGLSGSRRRELELVTGRVRQAGRQVRVLEPRYASIDLELKLCVAGDAVASQVREGVLLALFGNGQRSGFFDPDNFSFGTPLSRAALMATVQRVPGVRAVSGVRVRRRGRFGWRPFSEFMLRVEHNEMIQISNNRLAPEQGTVTLVMEGGA